MMQSYAALNTIALAINQGIEKKDIFVLDKAYKLNGKYKDFSEIDLNTLAINSVYAIGKPVSMEPNQDLVEIKYLFESLHKVNKILYRFAKKRITKEDRLEAYNVLKQKGFLFVLNFIIDKAKNKVEDEERLNVIKNVENECSKVLKKYQELVLGYNYGHEMLNNLYLIKRSSTQWLKIKNLIHQNLSSRLLICTAKLAKA